MKQIYLSALLAALLVSCPALLHAKDAVKIKPAPPAAAEANPAVKPVAVVSLSGYDAIMADVDFIGKLAGSAHLQADIEGVLAQFTQGAGLKGLDKTRPWGLTLSTDGFTFPVLLFLPVTDAKQLIETLGIFMDEKPVATNGVYALRIRGQKVFAKEQGGWAFVAPMPEMLAKLPEDPSKLLGSLPKTYEIGIRLYVHNVPDQYRTMAIDQIRASMQDSLNRKPDENEDAFKLRKRMVENQVKNFTTAVNETDQLTVGWSVNKAAKSSALDLKISALAETKMAKQFAQMSSLTTAFKGFAIPNAAATVGLVAHLDKDQAAEMATTIDGLRANAMQHFDKQKSLDDDAREAVKEAVGQLFDAYKATAKTGFLDAGGALLTGEDKFTLVAGGFTADPMAVENALKKSAKVLEDKLPEFSIKYDVKKHGTVRFHSLSFPVQKDQARKVLGDKLAVTVGIGTKSAYIALGANGISTLEKVIDVSIAGAKQKADPFQLNLSLAKIMKFVASVDPNPIAAMLAADIAENKDKDRLSVTGTADKNGVMYHLEAQEGVLILMGHAGKMAAGGMGRGQ